VENFEKFDKIKNHSSLPKHIGIIMDGNGRWAKSRGLPRLAGHNEGVNSVQEIVEVCGELGIKYLTIYTFSEENWKRPNWEVTSLMQLLVVTINKQLDRLMKKNVAIRTIGHLEKLPEFARDSMLRAVELTKNNSGLILNVALSYGGRQEIVDAVKRIGKKIIRGELEAEEITDQMIANQLDTAGQPDPDLVIRTGGEHRVSNFLLWQIAYAEIYVTGTPWPDFRKPQLLEAIWDFVHRERRYGMVSEQLSTNLAMQNA